MKTNHSKRTIWFLGVLLAAQAVSAQDQPASSAPTTQNWDPYARTPHLDSPSDSQSLNRITGSLRYGLNISGNFSGIGAGFNPYGPGLSTTTPNGNPYNYGDGYVYPDISGNAGGVTWNWGYDNVSQVNIGSSTVSMDNTIASSSTSPSQDIDSNPGFEFTYNRELGIVKDWHNMHYGIEAAFNFLPVSYDVGGTYSENMISTPYFLAGGIPPGYFDPGDLPYQGSFGNPAFVIGATPSGPSTVAPIPGSSLSVNDSYSGDLWGFRLGPYVEWPLADKLSLHLSGGFALGILDGSASWNEKLTLPAGVQTVSGSGSDTSILYGGYFSGSLSYRISRRWDVDAGVQYQNLGTYDHNFGGRSVNLEFDKSVFVLVGVSYHF